MTDEHQQTSEKTPRVGYVQVYTGDGKGKTTAALGLTLRALGAGLKVWISQFVKGMPYAELESMTRLGEAYPGCLQLHQHGRGCFIHGEPEAEDRQLARQGLAQARDALVSGRYDLVILDEANIATHFRLFPVAELLALMDVRPSAVELVITGRRAAPEVLKRADLITEMTEIRHYYEKGVPARVGIEM